MKIEAIESQAHTQLRDIEQGGVFRSVETVDLRPDCRVTEGTLCMRIGNWKGDSDADRHAADEQECYVVVVGTGQMAMLNMGRRVRPAYGKFVEMEGEPNED